MSFRNGAYATIWAVEPKEKYTNVRLSTSRKNRDGTYDQDFGGYVSFIGDAHTAASGLKEKDRIKILECSATSRYDKAKNTTYHNYQVYSFEPAESRSQQAAQQQMLIIPDDVDDEEMPF